MIRGLFRANEAVSGGDQDPLARALAVRLTCFSVCAGGRCDPEPLALGGVATIHMLYCILL